MTTETRTGASGPRSSQYNRTPIQAVMSMTVRLFEPQLTEFFEQLRCDFPDHETVSDSFCEYAEQCANNAYRAALIVVASAGLAVQDKLPATEVVEHQKFLDSLGEMPAQIDFGMMLRPQGVGRFEAVMSLGVGETLRTLHFKINRFGIRWVLAKSNLPPSVMRAKRKLLANSTS